MVNGHSPAHSHYQRATLLTTTSPVAGDPTWGLRRRLLLDEERQQVFNNLEIHLSQKQNLKRQHLSLNASEYGDLQWKVEPYLCTGSVWGRRKRGGGGGEEDGGETGQTRVGDHRVVKAGLGNCGQVRVGAGDLVYHPDHQCQLVILFAFILS